ncbi:sigma-70 family RNA polymerase sigma factor [Leucobacter zeae]|nr:sigma-70 family RNA polymerase sigma factor [Leucobacter zeae]
MGTTDTPEGSGAAAPTDSELCDAVRADASGASGRAAFAELFRRHRDTAMAQAYRFTGDRDRAEDLVSETFARVLRALSGGNGPTDSVLGYVLISLRSEAVRAAGIAANVVAAEPDAFSEIVDDAAPHFADRIADRDLILRSYDRLPPRDRELLWLLDVEEAPASVVGERLGLASGALRVAVHRARKRLGTLYLQQHVEFVDPDCRPFAEQLADYVRRRLGRRDARALEAHLAHCRSCAEQAAMLSDVGSRLRVWLAPLFLGAAAGGALTASGRDASAATVGAGGEGRDSSANAAAAAPRSAAAWFGLAAGTVLLISGMLALGAGSAVAPRSDSASQEEPGEDTAGGEAPSAPLPTASSEPPRDDATPHWRLRE